MILLRIGFFTFIAAFVFACSEHNKQDSSSNEHLPLPLILAKSNAPMYSFSLIQSYPHDPHNFTEGLIIDNGFIFESSGLYQQSKLQKKDFNTGKLLVEYLLPPQYFAEGIAIMGNDIYQLTYQEHTCFVYDKNTLKLKKIFHYPTEGWGLTSDGKQLIMSDGSATLYFRDPITFALKRTLLIQDNHQRINYLNALGYIHGKIYANIWPSDLIAIISPKTGHVDAWINIESLNTPSNCFVTSCVANGIAYHEKNDTVLVAGKNWLRMYEIKLTH